MTCGACQHFLDHPAGIEAAIPGLSAMGSAHASVRSDDGLCATRDRIASPRDQMPCFEARPQIGSAPTLTSSLPKF